MPDQFKPIELDVIDSARTSVLRYPRLARPRARELQYVAIDVCVLLLGINLWRAGLSLSDTQTYRR
jgi:hypothetical protein